MSKDKDEDNRNNDEPDKRDVIVANGFVIVLVLGLVIAGIAFTAIT